MEEKSIPLQLALSPEKPESLVVVRIIEERSTNRRGYRAISAPRDAGGIINNGDIGESRECAINKYRARLLAP